MNIIARIILAVVVGVLVTAILNYIPVLTPHINALIGVVAAFVVILLIEAVWQPL